MYYGIEFKKIFGKENLKNIFKEHSINHIFIFAFSLLLLLYTGKTNYKLFHSIIETLTAVACLSLFIIVINTYKISKNSFFIYLGIVYGFVSIFNLLHC